MPVSPSSSSFVPCALLMARFQQLLLQRLLKPLPACAPSVPLHQSGLDTPPFAYNALLYGCNISLHLESITSFTMDAEGDQASDDGGNSVERSDRVVMLPTNRTDGDDEEWGNPADSGGFPEEEKVEESFLEGWSTLFESGSVRKAPAPATTTAVEEAGSFAMSNASAADNPSIISSAYSSTARGKNHPPTTMPPAQDPEATLKEPDASADAGSRPTWLASRKKLLVIGALLVLVAVALAVVLPIVLIKDSSSTSPGGGNEVEPVCMNGQPPINNCDLIAGALAPVHPERTWSKLSTPGTCQHSALLWLSESNDILNIGEVKIQQRYALAVTYCELLGGGDDWMKNVEFGDADDDCFGDISLEVGPRVFNANCLFQIIELDGEQLVLNGTLAPELSIASNLTKVSIKNSPDLLGGTIPPEYGSLEKLSSLDLSNNRLSGTIPPSIFTPALEELLLHRNQLTGSVVIDLDVATNLRVVSLFDNSLSGDLNYVCGPGGSPAEFTVDIEVDCGCCASPPPTLSSTDAPAGSPTLAPEAGPTRMPAMEQEPKVTQAPIPQITAPTVSGGIPPMEPTNSPIMEPTEPTKVQTMTPTVMLPSTAAANTKSASRLYVSTNHEFYRNTNRSHWRLLQ